MWPPSSTGIGIRFKIPSWRLINASSVRNDWPPRAASRETRAISIGPENARTEISRLTRRANVWNTLLVMSTFHAIDAVNAPARSERRGARDSPR